MSTYPVRLILDSGAYSCWKKGLELDVRKYGEFALKYIKYLEAVVNLDQIPGAFGRVPSPSEVEASAAQSFKNLEILRSMGVNAMPVFHQGERTYWLEKMLDSGFDYIGISPANDRTTKQKRVWLDSIFELLCSTKGFPEVKTHGFGMTAFPLIFRYPWYSADSVTWLLVGGYGGILYPTKYPDGSFAYDKSPLVLGLSERLDETGGMSKSAVQGGKHYRSLGDKTRKEIKRVIESEGFTLENLRDNYLERQRWNARYFKRAAEVHTVQKFVHSPSLFDETSSRGSKKNKFGPLRFVFTLTTSPTHSDLLQIEQARDRLVSYFYFTEGNAARVFPIKKYVKTGRLPYSKRGKAGAAQVIVSKESDLQLLPEGDRGAA